ncbi:hypothetical protein WN51_08629 [Melipona quadrifasciata]|uniref:Ig-like domain-containing protein n=1 Tax=Melipona quadrifasciata TaxID=166423 RepID=A0A0M9A7K9_9HYME|nr:hypothetical protein WN51_08629 [Melipona quadrifasciata]
MKIMIQRDIEVEQLSWSPNFHVRVTNCNLFWKSIHPALLKTFEESTMKSFDISYTFAHPPIVSLNLGSTLSPEDIKEGDDVYFECHIRANPPWSKLTWIHDVRMIDHQCNRQAADMQFRRKSLMLCSRCYQATVNMSRVAPAFSLNCDAYPGRSLGVNVKDEANEGTARGWINFIELIGMVSHGSVRKI